MIPGSEANRYAIAPNPPLSPPEVFLRRSAVGGRLSVDVTVVPRPVVPNSAETTEKETFPVVSSPGVHLLGRKPRADGRKPFSPRAAPARAGSRCPDRRAWPA